METVISPHRADVVGQTVTSTQMNNILEFYSPLSSSSYAVFDTGWKYTYDRFNNAFVYVPCNADVVGTMVRTEIETFPWFSPLVSKEEVSMTRQVELQPK